MSDMGLFTYPTGNLGDDMQSYAILANLGRVDTFMDRDSLPDFPADRDTLCVFNSRFLQGKDFRPPSPAVKPIWHGFSAGRNELLKGEWLEYLRAQAPIGCRDMNSVRRLHEVGVDAYFTGCLTLFIGANLPPPERERKGVLFVDVPPEAMARMPADLSGRAVHTSTFVPPWLMRQRPLHRLAMAAAMADRIAGAELVVTRRLHVAMPAASFGTPVVVIPDPAISYARDRFAGFETIAPTVYLDELDGLDAIDWRNVPPPAIPAEITARYNELRSRLASLGLLTPGAASDCPLDTLGPLIRLRNTTGLVRPARVRFRLKDWSEEVEVEFWSTEYMDVRLSGFPGLSRIGLEFDVSPALTEEWIACGPVRDAVLSPEAG